MGETRQESGQGFNWYLRIYLITTPESYSFLDPIKIQKICTFLGKETEKKQLCGCLGSLCFISLQFLINLTHSRRLLVAWDGFKFLTLNIVPVRPVLSYHALIMGVIRSVCKCKWEVSYVLNFSHTFYFPLICDVINYLGLICMLFEWKGHITKSTPAI